MAKKIDAKAKDAEKGKSGKGAMIMGILGIVCSVLSLVAIVVLFAGIYNLGVIDLTHTLEKFAAPALLVLILASALGPFAKSKSQAAARAAAVAETEELKNILEQKIAAVEGKVETYLGENYNSLRLENDTMKERFEKIEAAERKKTDEERERINDELEELRAKNIELQEQLNKNAQLISEHTMAAEQLSAA